MILKAQHTTHVVNENHVSVYPTKQTGSGQFVWFCT